MLLNVKALDGTVHHITAADGAATTVTALKQQVEAATAVPATEMRLIFRGKVLADDKTLADYAVEDGFTVLLLRKPPAPPQQQQQQQQQAPPVQQQAPPVQPAQQAPVLPAGLFPQGPATDALNTILQQAFQQAMATGSGVNVNVSLNTTVPAPAAATAPAADAPASAPSSGPAPVPAPAPLSQMRVQVVPITQDIQTLMRDAFAQVTGTHAAPAEAAPAPAPETSEEDRAASALAGSMFTHLLNELREQDRTNPDGRLLDVVQRAYGNATGTAPGTGTGTAEKEDDKGDESDGDDNEDEDEEGNEEEAMGPLDSLMREICSQLTTHDFMGLLGRSDEAQCKVVSVARDALRKEMGDATVDEYTAHTMDALRQSFADSSLPAEVRERLRPGTSFAETLCATLQEPFAELCRTMAADSEPAQTLARVKEWAHASLVRVVDSLAAVLIGGVDDVQVIVRYFIYVVCYPFSFLSSPSSRLCTVSSPSPCLFSEHDTRSRTGNVVRDVQHGHPDDHGTLPRVQGAHPRRRGCQCHCRTYCRTCTAVCTCAISRHPVRRCHPRLCSLHTPLFCNNVLTHWTPIQDPVPSVETLRAALLARAAHDPVLTDIPLTDVYRAGALAKHA